MPGANAMSTEPSAASRTMRLRAVPLKSVNSPATSVRPLVSIATARAGALAPEPGLKVESTPPVASRRATLLRLEPLKAVKPPPMKILPLFAPLV